MFFVSAHKGYNKGKKGKVLRDSFSQSVREVKAVMVFLLIYFSLAWCNYFFNLMSSRHELDWFFALSFASFTGFALYRAKDLKSGPLFNDKKEWGLFLLLLGTYILSRYVKFPEMGVWLDEHTQFKFGNQMTRYSVIGHAIEEQQPPLDYVLGGFAGTLFGLSAFAVKFHALLFTFLFGALLPRAISFFSDNLVTRWLPAFILLFSNPLIAYSLEGRPLMIALFFSLIFLIFALNTFKTGKDWGWLLLSEMLFIHTTGLQPQLFIFFTLITLSALLLIKKDKKGVLKLLLSGFSSLILHIPLLYFLIIGTKETNQFNHRIGRNFFESIRFDSLRVVGEIYEQDTILIKLIGFFLIPTFFWFLKKRDFLKSSLIALPFIFLFGYFIVYKTFISWNFAIRYTYCFFALYGVALGVMLSSWERISFRKPLLILISGLVVVTGYSNTKTTIHESIQNIERPDWHSLFDYLNKEVSKEDYIVRVSFGQYGDWRGGIYVGDYIYANDIVWYQLVRHREYKLWDFSNHFFYDADINYKKKGRNLYILVLPFSFNPMFRDLNTESVAEKIEFRLIDLYRIPIKGSLYETKKKYFLELADKYPLHEHTTPIYETLLMLELDYAETKSDYESILRDYRDIRLHSSHTMDGLIYPKRSAHYERVKFFEKQLRLKWK